MLMKEKYIMSFFITVMRIRRIRPEIMAFHCGFAEMRGFSAGYRSLTRGKSNWVGLNNSERSHINIHAIVVYPTYVGKLGATSYPGLSVHLGV